MKSSQIKSGKLLKIEFFLIVAISFVCFFSCSKNVSSKSFYSSLDEIDRFISLSQFEPALKILSKIDKKNLPVDYQLGIYKRYLILGENKKAENLIKSAYKKNPNDLKIVALYSKSILNNLSTLNEKNQQDSKKLVLEISKKLSGTQYASIYAEAFFAQDEKNNSEVFVQNKYLSNDFINIYYDAFLGTKNHSWLRNCAIIKMCDARSAEAFEYFPNEFSDEKDALFWALISYDNKRFVESSNCLIFVKEKINEKNNLDFSLLENSKSKEENSFVELSVRALLADCYVNMGEERLAEKERSELLGFISSFGEDSEIYNEEKIAQNKNYSQEKKSAQNKNQIFEATLENQEKILSSVYLNSALYALKNSDYEVPYRLLTFVVNKWQDFVPGLIAYGNFSYDSNLRKLDDYLTQELRRLKISSMQMKAFDEFPAIPVEDALYKMKESLARQKDVKLYVALLELEDKYFRHSDEESLAKLYQTLERNSLGTNLYPTEIIHYAVSRFLILERVEEASSFFNKFIIQKYKFNENENFYDEFFKNIYKIENWEIEYAAWFAANEKKANLATNLYEFCVINRAEQNHHLENQVSPFASTSAIMNLAMIYSSTNNQNKAFEIYGQAANLTKNIFLKSECFYRIGILYQKKGDAENAIKALKHSIYLNPSHSKARLLLSKLVKI